VPPHFKDEGIFSSQFSKVGGLAIINIEDLNQMWLKVRKDVKKN
jgi:hypothetical protein